MSELNPVDRYVLKAEGKLESHSTFRAAIPNPDLPLGTMGEYEELQKESVAYSNKLFLRTILAANVLAGPPMFWVLSQAGKDTGVVLGGALTMILVSSMATLAYVLYMMTNYEKHDRAVLTAHDYSGDTIIWPCMIGGRIVRAYNLYEQSLTSLRTGSLDLDTELSLDDIEREMQLLLRRAKHEGETEENLAAIEDLAVCVTALELAWRDRWTAEEQALATALSTDGVNVRALVQRVAEDTAILTDESQPATVEQLP